MRRIFVIPKPFPAPVVVVVVGVQNSKVRIFYPVAKRFKCILSPGFKSTRFLDVVIRETLAEGVAVEIEPSTLGFCYRGFIKLDLENSRWVKFY